MDLRVLYEDSRAPSSHFGPHELLVGCVADDLARPAHEIRRLLDARPLNGVERVFTWLSKGDYHLPVVVLIDDDRVRRALKMRHDASSTDVKQAIRNLSRQPERLGVHLLQRNLETLITAIRDCAASHQTQDLTNLVGDALHKDLNARDILLGRIAHDPARRALRGDLRRRMPSFGDFVADVVAKLAP